jgi:hypothetical protein
VPDTLPHMRSLRVLIKPSIPVKVFEVIYFRTAACLFPDTTNPGRHP